VIAAAGFAGIIIALGSAVSLVVIGVVLVAVAVGSWIKVRRDPSAIAHAGRVTDKRSDDEPG